MSIIFGAILNRIKYKALIQIDPLNVMIKPIDSRHLDL
jgi:hypothetical protein